MNIATAMYALGLDQIASAIKSGGSKRTVLVQGHMGTGKSSLLKMLSADLPTHTACYFDCTTKDLGDISIPNLAKLNDGTGYVTYLTNEELGVHMGKPIILMIDEYGKANPAVKNAMLRLMLERKIGSYELHPESLVFATTNLGAEGVGDLLPPHARNRMTIITSRKPSNMEWIEWGINNGIDHTLLGWCKDNPQLFAGFEDVRDPDENPYIYHPQQQRAAFVTPRSLEAASDWLKQREHFDDQTLTSLLMGTIGERGAMDLMAFVKLADQLPSRESIKQDPMGAKVPDSASAICMVVYRSLASMDKEYIDPWMDYMARLDKEAQGMFANGVRQPKYSKQSLVMTNKKFTQWAMDNNYMFASDKK
jgi:energy-coupling factor transporter ATP-binding protein EcfA2